LRLTTPLLIFVAITPMCLAVPIAINSVAVLVTVRTMIVTVTSTGDDPTRKAHQCSERAQYGYPIKCIHYLPYLNQISRATAVISDANIIMGHKLYYRLCGGERGHLERLMSIR
jgi:hypothetical protein